MRSIITKILLGAVLTGSLVFPQKPVQAQWTVVEVGPLTATVIAQATYLGLAIGIPGTGAVVSAADVCDPAIKAVEIYDQKKTHAGWLSTLTFGLIGEGGLEATQLQAEKEIVSAAKTCIDIYLTALRKTPVPSLIIGQDLQRRQDEYSKLTNTYQTRLETIDSRQNVTVKKLLQAVMLRILQNVEKDLTTRVVNGLVQKFKISNYLQYADALGGQVYAMDYINKNFEGDARQQMMIRQLAQNDLIGQVDGVVVAKAFAQQKAEEFLGDSVNGRDVTSPDFYYALANAGSPQADPNYHIAQAQEQSAQAIARGMSDARLEIGNGRGFLPPRDCSGSISEQQELDRRQIELAQKVEFSRLVLAKLELGGLKVNAADLAQARADYEAAKKELAALPQEVAKPVVEICKAIENPGGAVADQIMGFLNKHLTESTDFKPENLPFFATFLSDVASNFITNIVTGGKSSGQLLTELGLGALQSAVGTTINTATNAPTTPPTIPTGTDTATPPGNDTGNGGGGGGGGQATPATCQQVRNANDFGVRLSCETLPTGPGTKFIMVIDYQSLLSDYNITRISIKQLTLRNNQQTVLVNDVPIDGTITNTPGTIRYEVDQPINEDSQYLVTLNGTAKTGQQLAMSRDAWLKITLPTTGQVQGSYIQKLSLRSFEGSGLITGRPGITLR